jgi:hypothetical protein
MMGPSSPDDLKDTQRRAQTLNRLCRGRSPPVQRPADRSTASPTATLLCRPAGVGERNPVEPIK